MNADLLPISTYGIVQTEYKRLRELSREVADDLSDELAGTPGTDRGVERRIEELREEIAMLEDEIANLEAGRFPVAGHSSVVKEQASTVSALLRQYEGIESEVLAEVLS